jgi:hypothetical protein
MSLVCRTHPRYLAKLAPRCACQACWWLYFRTRIDTFLTRPAGIREARC